MRLPPGFEHLKKIILQQAVKPAMLAEYAGRTNNIFKLSAVSQIFP